MVKITKYAHSTLEISNRNDKLLIDPGNLNFDLFNLKRDSFKNVNILIITHSHEDHFDRNAVKNIYASSRPIILTVKEVARELSAFNIDAIVLNVGETIKLNEFTITGVEAKHSTETMGVVIEANAIRAYYASDTFYLNNKPENIDIAMIPFNGKGKVMDMSEATRFCFELRPQLVIPIHYDYF